MAKKIGFFGGAFDPPHIGHVNAAKEAVRVLGLDKLIVVPTAVSPHKQNSDVSAQMRLEMTKIAFEDITECEVSDVEIARGGVSYTVDTLAHFSNLYKEDSLYFIMGTDMFLSFDRWRMPDKISEYATLAVFRRDLAHDKELLAQKEKLEKLYNTRVVIADSEPIEISSTEIRGGKNGAEKQLLPRVADYINANNLYLIPRIEAFIENSISQKRARHIFGVRETAVHMAERWGADTRKAEIAALLHDSTKEWTPEEHKKYALEHSEVLRDENPRDYKLFHAATGSVFAREHFGVTDKEILDAIRYHTSGRANMTLLDKIVFLADAVEPNRSYPELEYLRSLCEKGPDIALKWYFEWELAHLEAIGAVPSADTVEAYGYFAKRCAEDENIN